MNNFDQEERGMTTLFHTEMPSGTILQIGMDVNIKVTITGRNKVKLSIRVPRGVQVQKELPKDDNFGNRSPR